MRHTAFALASAGLIALLGAGAAAAHGTGNSEYVAMLVPAGGASGSGKAEISVSHANMLCTDLDLADGVTMTVGHVVAPGGVVLSTLEIPKGDDDAPHCEKITDAQRDAIKAKPGAFKVHVGTTKGDLFGDLAKDG